MPAVSNIRADIAIADDSHPLREVPDGYIVVNASFKTKEAELEFLNKFNELNEGNMTNEKIFPEGFTGKFYPAKNNAERW